MGLFHGFTCISPNISMFWAKVVFCFPLTLGSLHKVFTKYWWNGEVQHGWPLQFLCLMPGRWRGAPSPPAPGAPLRHTPHVNSSLSPAHSTQASSSLQNRKSDGRWPARYALVFWCGVWTEGRASLSAQTSTSRASGIRSGFGLLGTTLCFQPHWGWKHCGCRGTESDWNPRTRRITCLVERFFAFIPVPCCPVLHLT